MVDISLETVVSLTEATRFLPGRPHLSTLHRWRLCGVRGVRLETFLCGGKRFTSHEALARFFKATTAAADAKVPKLPNNRQNRATNSQIEAELKDLGFNR